MDTVSMLNTMHFYCQPILPLVYDESMSYYETLCKVVGQLNRTGETVNKLNEGLTNEISDRQAGDAALDKRIKELENTSGKLHFLKVDTLGHLLTPDINREKLSQWIKNGDLIVMLYAPDELENSWAVATSYRCLGATGADTMQLNFYVPISIVNNAGKSGSDVAQEVVVISLPVGKLTDQWAVRHITTTIPRTNADGFVNLTAAVSDSGAVTCDVEPGAIVEALRNYFSSTNQYAVAVNARLNYDGKQYHSGAATVKADTSGTGNIRIAFENYYDGVRAENGVRQTVNTTIFLVGDVKTNAWSVETIDYKTFDFSRYEGFQFTRGANNVIITNDESTPNAVYAQYHSDTSGKLYQNLPTRLIDSVDGAEYWNGTFDIYGGNHMTFTFVTSNYATASDKMLVRVIELSADVGTTAWKYGVKEFEVPFTGYEVITVNSTKVTDLGYDATEGANKYAVTFDASFDSILANLAANKQMKFNITLPDSTGGLPVSFNTGYVSSLNNAMYEFTGVIANSPAVLSIGGLESASVYLFGGYVPTPNPDDSDDGKTLVVNKHKWELKDPTSNPLYISIDVTNIDERIYTLTDGNKTYTVEEIYEAKENGTPVFIAPADIGYYFQILDFSFSNTAFKAFFLNVVRRTDMSYGRLTISTIGGQTKGTYIAGGFLAASSSANNGKFLKIKQDGSGIEYVDGSTSNAILYTPQTLTDEQKKQARDNIDSAADLVTETAQVLPAYTNLIPISTDASGAVLNGVGYETGALHSDGSVASASSFTSGFIPVKKGDVVRIKDSGAATFSLDNAVALYKADKAVSAGIGKYIHGMQTSAAYGGLTIDGDVLTWDTSSINYYSWQDFKFLRVTTSSADSIVTINEEIKESAQTVMRLRPTVKVSKDNLDFAVNEPMLAGRKIVVFGDSLIGMTRDQTSVTAYAAEYTGAKVYNVGFGGCRMAKHPTNGYAAFSMWALADAVSTGNYSTQDAQAPSGQDYFASQLAVLKSIDFASVDSIVIHYGTNDFAASVPLDDSANLLSTETVCGALRYSIKKLLTAFPKIKIFVSLPLYRTWSGVGAETYKNTLEKTLPDYDSAMKTVAEDHNLPAIDGYKQLGINSINSSAYLSDGTHLNDFGRKQFGEFIGGRLICGA